MTKLKNTLKTGTILGTDKAYQIGVLDPTYVEDSHQFQVKIKDGLPAGEKEFVLVRGTDFLKKLQILACLVDDKIIGQAMLYYPKQGEPNGVPGWKNPPKNENIAVLDGLAVLPSYQGKGIGNVLTDMAYKTAEGYGKMVSAEVEIKNIPSLTLQFNQGAHLCAAAYSPEDGAPVAYTCKYPLKSTSSPKEAHLDFSNITVEKIAHYMAKSYVGVGIHKDGAKRFLVMKGALQHAHE